MASQQTSQQTLAQRIQDTLAPHQANGHVVHLRRIPWFKWPQQIEDWVIRIDRQRQVELFWLVMDEASIQAGKHNIGYAWVVCESKYAASRLPREINHDSRRNTCFGRTLEASHIKHSRPRLPLQQRHPTTRPTAPTAPPPSVPPIMPAAPTAPPPPPSVPHTCPDEAGSSINITGLIAAMVPAHDPDN